MATVAARSPTAARRAAVPLRVRARSGVGVVARGGTPVGVRSIKGETFLVAALLYRLAVGKG